MDITRRIEFDAGHRVPGHRTPDGERPGPCSSPHGHRYRLEVTVNGDVPADGMVLDFGIVKRVLMDEVHAHLDHAMLVWALDETLRAAISTDASWKVAVLPDPPTAENLAGYIARVIDGPLADHGVELRHIRLYETPNCWADWSAP